MPDGTLAPAVLASACDGLVFSHDDGPGITRRGAGRGFAYYDAKGRLIRDPDVVDRIHKLAIPPAWTDVWISPSPRGHIQAVGRDAKGRKQYRYHDQWSAGRAETKYARLAAFGRALPKLRERVEQDLGKRGPSRDKVLATAVRLLEISLIRVGNKEYARQNHSFGLTTLHKRHIDVDGAALALHFVGKSGVEQRVSVRDRRLARVVQSLQDLPGQRLFKYRGDDGELAPIDSSDVNGYIRETMGDDFSAKDFRTWAATVSAARALCLEPAPESAAAAKRTSTQAIKAVAAILGNTPTVCRSSYIHPAVLDAFAEGRLADAFPDPEDEGFEKALIAFLESCADRAKAA
ncbi:MAG TPA: DNA topoisomerase IB [Caulobacteraceae bacterium]|jgi:DNA topoisomerase-1|nr:DNA topoisomerase IB [Caulobacteraceae bacterium]